jgi:hypothetical protein
MNVPVFHDDQHGTAIIAAAAVLNGLTLVGKDIRNVKLACSGAGAAAIACLDQLVSLGLRTENILVTDERLQTSHAIKLCPRFDRHTPSMDHLPAPRTINANIPPAIARSFSKCSSSFRLAKFV